MKKYEALYALAKGAYDADIARLDAAEAKAARFVSLLTILVGLNAAGYVDFLAAMHDWPRWSARVFVVSYAASSVLNAIAFVYFFRALAVSKVLALRVEGEFSDHFQKHPYVEVLFSMARRFFQVTAELRKKVDTKPLYVRIGFRWFSAALLVGAIALGSYTMWKSEKSGAKMTQNQPEQTPPAVTAAPAPATSAAPAPEGGAAPPPADPTAPLTVQPNPAVTAPTFVELERGLPSTPNRDTNIVKVPPRKP